MALRDFFKRAQTQKVAVPNAKQYLLDRGKQISTGISFDSKRAELNSTVFTCINLLQSMVSKCDLEIYQIKDGRKTKLLNHNWYDTIRYNPDLRLSTKKWLGYALTSMYLDGNFFAYVDPISKKFRSLPELEKVSPVLENENDYYLKFKGIDTWLPSSNVIHFYIISKDGRLGLNPIASIKTELEIQGGGEAGVLDYYRNGMNNHLYLKPDIESAEKFGDKNKAKEFINKIQEEYGSIFNSSSIPVIPTLYDLKVLPKVDLDYLANNKYSIAQIGSLFGVPEPYLGIQGASQTYGKAAEQVALFNSTLSNVTAMIEDELCNKILTIDERKKGIKVEFDLTNLFANDPETNLKIYQGLNGMGAATANEARQAFGLEWIEDNEGANEFYRQAQYVPLGTTQNNPITPFNQQ